MRDTRPDLAAELDARAEHAEEEARHEGHTTVTRYGTTRCSCGTILGVACWDPTPLLMTREKLLAQLATAMHRVVGVGTEAIRETGR